eukprot:SAG11_NODE_640_length_8012_cov_14.412486_7_plen_68_part_00
MDFFAFSRSCRARYPSVSPMAEAKTANVPAMPVHQPCSRPSNGSCSHIPPVKVKVISSHTQGGLLLG